MVRWTCAITVIVSLLLGWAPSARAEGFAPAGFLENRGQLDDAVLYYSPAEGLSLFLTPGGVVLSRAIGAVLEHAPDGMPDSIREFSVRLSFEEANAYARIEARQKLPGSYHFLIGENPTAWRTGVSSYAEIIYHDLWPGVDLVIHRSEDALEYHVVTASNTDLDRVRFHFEGADRVSVGGQGRVSVDTAAGVIEVQYPGRSQPSGRVEWAPPDGERPARTGPAFPESVPENLLWCTYLGSFAQHDVGKAVVLDGAQNPLVTGFTRGADFPTTIGAFETTFAGGYDAFVAKLSAVGDDLMWATFLGGDGFDFGTGIAIDPSGDVVVLGTTGSTNFPTTPGALDSIPGMDDIFVARLAADGSDLIWSTLLGGSDGEQGSGIALDFLGVVHVAGITVSADFPTTAGAFDDAYHGDVDGCVSALSASGSSLLWSTYLGSSGHENVGGIAVTSAGETIVTGITGSAGGGASDFPTTAGAYDQIHDGGNDVFVSKFDVAGAMVWSTFLGGSLDAYANFEEFGHAMALDSLDRPIVVGTAVAGFPTTPGAFDETPNGVSDAFAAKLDASGGTLLWSTFLGGTNPDEAWAVFQRSDQDVIVAGSTSSADFPTIAGAFDDTFNGGKDAFILRLDGDDGGLSASTYLGGTSDDYATGVAGGWSGQAVLTGWTLSADFPATAGAFDPTPGTPGRQDAFAASVLMGPLTDVPPQPVPLTGKILAIPNPARSLEAVRFMAGATVPPAVLIFDAGGRLVRSLGGELHWDGRDQRGSPIEPGVYFYTFGSGVAGEAGKLVILR